MQIEVYDALEKMHDSDWKGSNLSTEQLLLTSKITDKELNSKIMKNINNHSQKNSTQKGVAQINCVVGSKNCLYEDKKALINGDVTQLAQTKFLESSLV